MKLTVLSVAFPFAPVDADPVGGAEQVLAYLDLALVERGHRSVVIATRGSQVAGDLVEVPRTAEPIDDIARHRAHRIVNAAIESVLAHERIDLVHFHGIDFDAYLPQTRIPLLASLHLPLAWYALLPAEVRLQPVSQSQARSAPPNVRARLLPPIENGVALARFAVRAGRRRFALALSRICPEKGVHEAIAAAALARVPLLIAGEVFPFAAHREYFETHLRPRLGEQCRFIGPVAGARKCRLLAAARCVLLPSRAQETSSLVAMESAAAGTPVVAYRSGSLPDVIEDGRSGWLVDDVESMAHAIGEAAHIERETCRAVARRRFDAARMTAQYLDLYRHLARGQTRGAAS